MFRIFLFTSILVVFVIPQELQPVLSQDEPSVEWFIIESLNFRVIYPRGCTFQANKVIHILEKTVLPYAKIYRQHPRPITLILHNQSLISNAYVALGPRRSEWVLTAPQNSFAGSTDWLTLLGFHEYSHVMQLDKARTGLSKALWNIAGDYGLSVANALALPPWFWEGDAVGMETQFTRGGRGRLPEFHMPYRALLLSRGLPNYEEASLGSFKTYYPDSYRYGYLMTSYLKRSQDKRVWTGIIARAAGWWIKPFTFSSSIKKASGLSLYELHQAAMFESNSAWRKALSGLEETSCVYLTPPVFDGYTDYRQPKVLSSGDIIALKEGFSDLSQLVLIDSGGKERRLVYTGHIIDNSISAGNNLVVWSAYHDDPRWDNKDFTSLFAFNLKKQAVSTLKTQTRLLSPAVSRDDRLIAAVEILNSGEESLSVFSVNGDLTDDQYIPKDKSRIINPSWSEDGKAVFFISQKNNRRAILQYHLSSKTVSVILPFSDAFIDRPVQSGEYIYFHSALSGIDNIHAYHIPTKKEFQVTRRKFGAFDPYVAPGGKTLIFSDYSASGYRVASFDLKPETWVTTDSIIDRFVFFNLPIVEESNVLADTSDTTAFSFAVNTYNPKSDLFRIHSWYPFYTPVDHQAGLSFQSVDFLQTLPFAFGGTQNVRSRRWGSFASISFQKNKPVFDLSFWSGSVLLPGSEDDKAPVDFNKNSLYGGIRNYQHYVRKEFSYRRVTRVGLFYRSYVPHIQEREDGVNSFSSSVISFSLNWSKLRLLVKRDLVPTYGYSINSVYHHSLNKLGGFQFGSAFSFYRPGLLKQSIRLIRFGAELNSGNQIYEPYLSPIRGIFLMSGYSSIAKGSVGSVMPIAYPDLRIGPFLYFQRLKAGFFFDFAYTKADSPDGQLLASASLEVAVDVNLMRFYIPFEPGVRLSYTNQSNLLSITFLLYNFGVEF